MYVREKTARGRKCRTRLGFELVVGRVSVYVRSRFGHSITSFEMKTKGLGTALNRVGAGIMGDWWGCSWPERGFLLQGRVGKMGWRLVTGAP
jgi:hypothetical protein